MLSSAYKQRKDVIFSQAAMLVACPKTFGLLKLHLTLTLTATLVSSK